MRFEIFVLLGLALRDVWAHLGAPDEESEDERNATSSYSFRFATSGALQNESLLNLYWYQSPEDQEGTLISLENQEEVASRLRSSSTTYVMFNGHPSTDSVKPYAHLRKLLLQDPDVNVISVFVDWTRHKIIFIDALYLADSFGKHIGTTLQSFQIPSENYHFIAHCAGAEVASFAAEHVYENSQTKISRLTAFDPYVTEQSKLHDVRQYADFVDVYHAGIYDPPFKPLGTVDFYPNAGVEQPGCQAKTRLLGFICHHLRSIYLYAESVKTAVNAVETKYNETENNLQVLSQPKIALFGHFVDRFTDGAFYLPTRGNAPYLINYF